MFREATEYIKDKHAAQPDCGPRDYTSPTSIGQTGLATPKSDRSGTHRSAERRVFFHWEFHPRGLQQKDLRRAFEATLGPALEQDPTFGKYRLTIAFSNPTSLGQSLYKTTLKGEPGNRASDWLAKHRSENTP